MTALVDTSVLVRSAAGELDEPWVVSAISLGELQAGILLAQDPQTRAHRLRRFTAIVVEAPILPVDHAVAARYGELRSATQRKPANDLWIAATALAHDLTLVTADERLASLPLVRTTLVT